MTSEPSPAGLFEGRNLTDFDYIQAYIKSGFPVFPCKADKQPKTIHGFKEATTDEKVIWKEWKGMWGDFIGVLIPKGFIAIDVDVKGGAKGPESLSMLIEKLGPLPETLSATTATGGKHYIFSYNPAVIFPCVNSKVAENIDIKASGKGYLICAPGCPQKGKPYKWDIGEEEFLKCKDIKKLIAPLPEAWAKYILSISEEKKIVKNDGKTAGGKYPEGCRNSSLTSEIGYQRAIMGVEGDALLDVALALNEIKCDPPLPAKEVENIVKSVGGYNETKLETFCYDDIGNSQRLIKCFGDKLRFCETSKKWVIYNGKKWIEGDAGAHRLAQEVVARMKARLKVIESKAEKEDIVKAFRPHVKKSASAGQLKAMLDVAHSNVDICVSETDFDNSDQCCYKLNVGNGTLHLENLINYTWSEIQENPGLILKEHSGADMLTKCIDINFAPKKDCPKFLDMLQKVFKNNNSLIDYIQAFLGTTLTDSTQNQIFHIWYGNGANGKTTLINFLNIILKIGVYADTIPIEYLKKSDKNEKKENHMAKIKGARLVTSVEPSENFRLDDSLIKMLTGNDTITARKLYGEPFDYRATYKLIITTNNKPIITATDNGIWRRVKLIPFDYKFEGKEKIESFEKTIVEEYQGVLNWLIMGLLKVMQLEVDGKKLEDIEPECVKVATAEYRQESDIIQGFIAEKCKVSQGLRVPTNTLYTAFKDWYISAHGDKPLSETKFVTKLKTKGFGKSKTPEYFEYRGHRTTRCQSIFGIDLIDG